MEQSCFTERPDWIAGFVDGEGCFTLKIGRSNKATYKIQVQLEFFVAQHERSKHVLHDLQKYFGCGYVCQNKNCFEYRVHKTEDLRRVILPFFKKYPLLTNKKHDFDTFCTIFDRMSNGEHLNASGLMNIVQLGYTMNSLGASRKHTLEAQLKRIEQMNQKRYS